MSVAVTAASTAVRSIIQSLRHVFAVAEDAIAVLLRRLFGAPPSPPSPPSSSATTTLTATDVAATATDEAATATEAVANATATDGDGDGDGDTNTDVCQANVADTNADNSTANTNTDTNTADPLVMTPPAPTVFALDEDTPSAAGSSDVTSDGTSHQPPVGAQKEELRELLELHELPESPLAAIHDEQEPPASTAVLACESSSVVIATQRPQGLPPLAPSKLQRSKIQRSKIQPPKIFPHSIGVQQAWPPKSQPQAHQPQAHQPQPQQQRSFQSKLRAPKIQPRSYSIGLQQVVTNPPRQQLCQAQTHTQTQPQIQTETQTAIDAVVREFQDGEQLAVLIDCARPTSPSMATVYDGLQALACLRRQCHAAYDGLGFQDAAIDAAARSFESVASTVHGVLSRDAVACSQRECVQSTALLAALRHDRVAMALSRRIALAHMQVFAKTVNDGREWSCAVQLELSDELARVQDEVRQWSQTQPPTTAARGRTRVLARELALWCTIVDACVLTEDWTVTRGE